MSKPLLIGSAEYREAVDALFSRASTVFIEVRFPFVSSDFYLCETVEELDEILRPIAPGIPIYLSAAADLVNPKGDLVAQKDKKRP